MTDRTETCTPQERRLLDLMWRAIPTNVGATATSAVLHLEDWPIDRGSGHELAEAFCAAWREQTE